MTGVAASRETRLCARELHEDVPGNEYRPPGGGSRRCRPCRAEYMRDRRSGGCGGFPAGRARAVGRLVTHGRPRAGPLTEEEVAALRAAVGCVDCGAAPRVSRGAVVTRHARGCAVAPIREGAA